MDAIIRFLQDTGFYLFSQDGNWRCLIMLGIACVLLYLGIVKKFEPLLLVPIAFGMLITNLPGANMFHEIFFAGGHIHWDLIGGQPVTASLLADLHSQGVAENVLAPYIQQLMTAAQTTFSPEMVEQAIAAVTEEAGAAITPLEAQLQALVQAEQAAAYYGMTLSDIRRLYAFPERGPVGAAADHPPAREAHEAANAVPWPEHSGLQALCRRCGGRFLPQVY